MVWTRAAAMRPNEGQGPRRNGGKAGAEARWDDKGTSWTATHGMEVEDDDREPSCQ